MDTIATGRRMRQVVPWAIALLGMLGGRGWAAGPVAHCDPRGADFCDLKEPEDIAFIPGSDWMAVSTAAPEAPLVFINVHSRQRVPLTIPFTPVTERRARSDGDLSAPGCPGPPTYFRPGGNDIKRVGSEIRLAVINRPDPATVPPEELGGRVELFSIAMATGTPEARWLGCFPVPLPYWLNDVALGPRGELYASHQFERTHSAAEAKALKEKFLAHVPTGFALEWTHGHGWTRVPGTDVSFANGIAVSLDDRYLAVAGTYSEAVVVVDRRRGTAHRISILPITPDNLTPLTGGGFIVVGHTGAPVTGIDPCRSPSASPCGFPFAVARIDRHDRVTTLFEHDGTRIPGASVAVLHGDKLYLGSAFGDRITVVDRPPDAPID